MDCILRLTATDPIAIADHDLPICCASDLQVLAFRAPAAQAAALTDAQILVSLGDDVSAFPADLVPRSGPASSGGQPRRRSPSAAPRAPSITAAPTPSAGPRPVAPCVPPGTSGSILHAQDLFLRPSRPRCLLTPHDGRLRG